MPPGKFVQGGMFFSIDGKPLIATADGGTVNLWKLTDKQEKVAEFPGHEGDIINVFVSPDRKLMATVDKKGAIRLWNITSGELIADLPGKKYSDNEYKKLIFSRSGRRMVIIVSQHGSPTLLWDWVNNQLDSFKGSQEKIIEAVFTKDDSILLVSDKGHIFNWSDKKQPISVRLPNHLFIENNFTFSPDGKQIVNIRFHHGCLQLEHYKLSQNQSEQKTLTSGCAVAFSNDSNKLAIADEFGNIYLYSSGKLEKPMELKAYKGGVTKELIFSPDGKQLIS
ncbi:WD40 repeat domain-containing protein [Nostoc sp. UIC 10890]